MELLPIDRVGKDVGSNLGLDTHQIWVEQVLCVSRRAPETSDKHLEIRRACLITGLNYPKRVELYYCQM